MQFCFLARWDSSPEKTLAILTEQVMNDLRQGLHLHFCNLSRAFCLSVAFLKGNSGKSFPKKALKSIIKNYSLFKNNYISRIASFFS